MAEKRVSVRLVAEGGKAVRAELEGIGDAGARGAGRLSTAMDQANARLAGFAARARVAAGVAAAAAVAGGVAIVRSGLQTIDAQAKLAQSLGTTVASIQVLERAGQLAGVSMQGIEQATKDLTRRLSQAADGTGPAVKALDRLHLSAAELQALPLDQRIAAIQEALARYVPEAQRAAVASQLFGDEGALAFSRIDTATLKQATADLVAFGAILSDEDAEKATRATAALSRLGLIATGLGNQLTVAAAPGLEAVANALGNLFAVSGPVGSAIQALGARIGEIATIGATFAALMAGKWVVGLVAAAFSVNGLATALVFLRGALLRTGIGILVVGAGELVYQFSRLVQGAGGFGNAMALLGDVAREVFNRMKLGVGAVAQAFFAAAASVEVWWGGMLHRVNVKIHEFARGAVDILARVAGFLDPEKTYEDFAAKIPAVADVLAAPSEEASKRAVVAWNRVRDTWSAASAPLTSVQALKDAVASIGKDGDPVVKETTETVEDLGGALGGAAGKAREVKEELSGFEGAIQSLKSFAADAADVGKGLGDTLVGAFRGAEDAFRNFAKTGTFDFKGMVASILADLATLSFKSAVLGPLAKALVGGFGGDLFAGLFHRGGMVGLGGGVPVAVPAMAFAGAPRLHAGGRIGFAPDEVPAILQRGERVLSRDEVARGAGSAAAPSVSITIDARGAQAGVADQIDARLRAVMPEIKRLAVQSVAEARARGTI